MEKLIHPEIKGLTIGELRRWSAEDLMGFTGICSPDCDKYPLPYYQDKEGNKFTWHPDNFKTGQIWIVIKKMREQLPDGSDGFNFNLNWQAHKGITISIAQFHKIDPFIHGQGADDLPCIATLIATFDARRNLCLK